MKKAADGTVDKLKQRLGSLVGQEEEQGAREQPQQADSDPISAHFAELNSLVSKGEGGNEPAPIDSLLEDMNALYVQVSAMAGASGDFRCSATPRTRWPPPPRALPSAPSASRRWSRDW